MRVRERLLDAALASCIVASLATTSIVLRRNVFRPTPVSMRDERIGEADWRNLVQSGHRIGPATASLVLVEFGDFECPACGGLYRLLRRFDRAHPGEVAVIFHHLPLPYHESALPLALGAECAGRQASFGAFYNAVYSSQRSIPRSDPLDFARVAGIDTIAFSRCMSDSTIGASIAKDTILANKIHAVATPTLVVNGVRLGRGVDSATFEKLLLAARKRATHN
jgi:protein-disulfide isomerase